MWPAAALSGITGRIAYQIQNATAINNNGQIVANTTNNHTLLLTPS